MYVYACGVGCGLGHIQRDTYGVLVVQHLINLQNNLLIVHVAICRVFTYNGCGSHDQYL